MVKSQRVIWNIADYTIIRMLKYLFLSAVVNVTANILASGKHQILVELRQMHQRFGVLLFKLINSVE
jgi:hypothetical protein